MLHSARGDKGMGINNEVFKFNREMNRRENIDSYQTSFPLIQALELEGSDPGDANHENAITDFSAAPELYIRNAFTFADAYITQLHITIETSSSMTPSDYGDITSGITNGIIVAFFQRGEFRVVSPAITTNSELQIIFNEALDSPALKFGDKLFTVTLTLDTPLIMQGGSTDFFAVQVNDDFTSLINHRFVITGWTTNLLEFQGT